MYVLRILDEHDVSNSLENVERNMEFHVFVPALIRVMCSGPPGRLQQGAGLIRPPHFDGDREP